MGSLVVDNSHLFPALYNYSQFVHFNWEKGEEAAVTSNGLGTQERGDAAGITFPEKRRGGGRARGREVRWQQSFTVAGHRERGVGERSEAWLLMGKRGGEV